jgi:uncharacterized protein (TIGR03437 family)
LPANAGCGCSPHDVSRRNHRGQRLIGDNGPAAAAQIASVQGIAFDRSGNLYLSDTDHNRVRRVSASGTITTIAGNGTPGFSGDGGPAASAQLNLPYGLAVDAAGNLYIADLGNQRIRRVAHDGTITTIAGDGHKGFSVDGTLAAQASLVSPRNLAIDDSGALYISEFEGHRVRRMGADGKLITVAGAGQTGFRGDGGAAASALLNFPAGLAVDHTGALYIADFGNNRVRRVASGIINTVLGGSTGTALSGPLAVTLDSAGAIYVADSTSTVRCFTQAGKWINYAGTGVPQYTGDGGPAAKASLTAARDVAVSSGGVYIADSVRVRVVDVSGMIHTFAGDGYIHAVGDGSAATSANLLQPLAAALDRSGNLFVADTGTQRVRQVAPGGTITTFAGTGTPGAGADGASASDSALNAPMGVAMDMFGDVLIADTYNHRIRLVGPDRSVRTVAGTGSSGYGFDGSAPLATALRGPRGICTDRTGNLYIADTSNHRVLRAPLNGVVQTVAGNGSAGDSGDGGPAAVAQLNQPFACAVDSYGNVFIADTFNHVIRRVSFAGVISTVAGSTAGMSGDEGPATAASLNQPMGVAVDDAGNIYIADTGNNRIRQVTPDGVIHTIAGHGAAGFAGDGSGAAEALLNGPAGLFLDGAGALYFADSGNNRIRRLIPQAGAPPNPVIVVPPSVTVVNALSLKASAVAPGEIVSIFGTGIGPEAGMAGALDGSGVLTNLVSGVEVRFDGARAPLFYVQAGQVNAQAPYSIAGAASTHVELLVSGKTAGVADLAVTAASPALLPMIVNQSGSVNSDSDPAQQGALLTLYATGEGLTDGANITGQPAGTPLAHPRLPVTLTIAGLQAEVLFAGSAPGLIGVMQINARVPAGFLAPGKTDVALTVGGIAAPIVPLWLK